MSRLWCCPWVHFLQCSGSSSTLSESSKISITFCIVNNIVHLCFDLEILGWVYSFHHKSWRNFHSKTIVLPLLLVQTYCMILILKQNQAHIMICLNLDFLISQYKWSSIKTFTDFTAYGKIRIQPVTFYQRKGLICEHLALRKPQQISSLETRHIIWPYFTVVASGAERAEQWWYLW